MSPPPKIDQHDQLISGLQQKVIKAKDELTTLKTPQEINKKTQEIKALEEKVREKEREGMEDSSVVKESYAESLVRERGRDLDLQGGKRKSRRNKKRKRKRISRKNRRKSYSRRRR